MKKQAVERLKKTLIAKTGLDFENYRNPEVMATIADILIFPIYAVKSVLLPLLLLIITLLISCIVFGVLGKAIFGVFLFFLVGLLVCTFNGVPLGIINFIRTLTGDIRSIINLTIDQAQNIIQDIENVKDKAVNNEFEYPKVSEVIAGVVYIIVLPTVTEVIAKKIPKVGRLIGSVITKMMDLLAERMIGMSDEQEEKAIDISEQIESGESTNNSFYQKGIVVLETLQGKINSLTDGITKVLSMPFWIMWGIVVIISVIVMYPIYLLL